MVAVVEVSGLRKEYGRTLAVADVSFEVEAGEIFGLLGPNGSGKTTTVECLQGLRRADAGESLVGPSWTMSRWRSATSITSRSAHVL